MFITLYSMIGVILGGNFMQMRNIQAHEKRRSGVLEKQHVGPIGLIKP
jgi:hypothetical protein